MKEKDLLEFIHFFTHNKNLTRSQRLKRNKLLARDYAEGAESLHEESPQRLDFESAHDEVDGPTKSIPYYRTGVNGVNYVSPQHIQSFLISGLIFCNALPLSTGNSQSLMCHHERIRT